MVGFKPLFDKETQPFYIQHFTSNLLLHPTPKDGSAAKDGTTFLLRDGYEPQAKFSFIPIADEPGYGLIKHIASGMYLQPDSDSPGSRTKIVVKPRFPYTALWAINNADKNIRHATKDDKGYYLHQVGGDTNAKPETAVHLYRGIHPAARFVPVSADGDIVNVNGAAIIGGHWHLVYSKENPLSDQELDISYRLGLSKTTLEQFDQ